MTCGVHLGILLTYLVHAEHVCCLWASRAQNSQRQNGHTYVPQQGGGLRLGGSYPQNQLRQASVSPDSAQSSSLNTETAVNHGYRQRPSSSGYTQMLAQLAQDGYTSVKFVKSSSLSKPDWQLFESSRVNGQKWPKWQLSSLSTPIGSGGSLSKYKQIQDDLTDVRKKRMWPSRQGAWSASKSLSSSSASVPGPRSRYSFSSASHQPAVQQAPSAAAETPAYSGQKGYPPSRKSSSVFCAEDPAPQANLVLTKASVRAPARKGSSRRKANKHSRFPSPQNGRARNDPSHIEAVQPDQSKPFLNGGNTQGRDEPTSTSNMAHSQSLPVSSQWLYYNPSYASTEQMPSGTSSLQASRNPAQGGRDLAASRSSSAGHSVKCFAPTLTHSIPKHFGGYVIRRLKEPADQKEVSEQTYAVPSQQAASYNPQVQSLHQKTKWKRIRPHQGH